MRHRLVATLVGAGVALAAVPAGAINLTHEISYLFTSVSINPPTATRMTVCYGFGCRRRMEWGFTPGDRKALSDILAKGRANAEAERKAVQQAVVWFDRRMGPILGTDKRIARADFRYFDDKHNYDCWDTTRNTVSLLLVMQDWGLLRHHVVSDPQFRGKFFIGQTPHNTAVLTDKKTGTDWVVDMWTRGYAEVPDVMTVEKWLTED